MGFFVEFLLNTIRDLWASKLVFKLDSAQNELKEGSTTNRSMAVAPRQRLKKLLPCLERIFTGAGSPELVRALPTADRDG